MAEIHKLVQLYNEHHTGIQAWLNENHGNPEFQQRQHPLVAGLAKYKSEVLEELLLEKGLDVCHFADIHYFSPLPENWELDELEWKVGMFPRNQGKLFYRAEVSRGYGYDGKLEVSNPELFLLCPEHFPKYAANNSQTQTKDGWKGQIQSGVTMINGKLHPIADLEIIIPQPPLRKRPELVFKHFRFL